MGGFVMPGQDLTLKYMHFNTIIVPESNIAKRISSLLSN